MVDSSCQKFFFWLVKGLWCWYIVDVSWVVNIKVSNCWVVDFKAVSFIYFVAIPKGVVCEFVPMDLVVNFKEFDGNLPVASGDVVSSVFVWLPGESAVYKAKGCCSFEPVREIVLLSPCYCLGRVIKVPYDSDSCQVASMLSCNPEGSYEKPDLC